MTYQEQAKLDELCKKLGSRYRAVNYIAAKARTLMIDSFNVISESEAIRWVILNEVPPNLEERIDRKVEQLKRLPYENMEELLCTIDDVDVQDSVRESLRESVRVGRLTYLYGDTSNSYKRARIRVLTNIGWFGR